MKLQLLTDTGSLIREWPLDEFGDLSKGPEQAHLGYAVHLVQRSLVRQSERLPDLVPPGPTYRLIQPTTPAAVKALCNRCRGDRISDGPTHDGVPHCQSGSIASGGTHAHCSCEACY